MYPELGGEAQARRKPVIEVRIRNRGRQTVQIRTLCWSSWSARTVFGFPESVRDLPLTLAPNSFGQIVLGLREPYEHGRWSGGRFWVMDGADRVHPVRARWLPWIYPTRNRALLAFGP